MALTFLSSHCHGETRPAAPTRLLLPLILVVFQTAGLGQAENHSPVIKLSMAFTSQSNEIVASEQMPLKSLLGILEVEDPDQGPEGEVLCDIQSRFVGLETMVPNSVYKIALIHYLDREETAREETVIQCADRGSPPLASIASFDIIITDINDNVPTFSREKYEFSVEENSPIGSTVGVVSAVDLDEGQNGYIEYGLDDETGNSSTQFTIDPKKGIITTTAVLDREMQEQITLFTYAYDHGLEPMYGEALVTVTVVDRNDHHPVILTSQMSVPEELAPMTLVGKIEAQDLDSGINAEIEFNLLSDEITGSTPPFIVESDGSVYAAVPLDREIRDSYVIKVSVSDGGTPPLSNTSSITIVVVDTNDHAPVIISPKYGLDFDEGNSSEDVSVDWLSPDQAKDVFQMVAYDHDIGENGRLLYIIDAINSRSVTKDSLFGIDNTTGRIFLQRYIRADDEPVQILSLLVQDAGVPSLVTRAWLNVTLDVDFSALTLPPPSTTTTTTVTTQPGNSASPTVSVFSHLHSLCLLCFFHRGLLYLFCCL